MYPQYVEKLKTVRTAAKQLGMTFKKQNATINGTQAYKFVCRGSGAVIASNYTLYSAYDAYMHGELQEMIP